MNGWYLKHSCIKKFLRLIVYHDDFYEFDEIIPLYWLGEVVFNYIIHDN